MAVFAQSSNDVLFPDATQGFFEVSGIDAIKAQWQQTRLGTLLKDPIMQSARDEVKKQIDANWINRLGLTLDDLQLLPTGPISGGMIAVPGAMPGFVLIISVKGQTEDTLEFMQRIGKKLEEQGVKKATTPIDNVTATFFIFDKTEQNPQGGIAVYLLTKDTLVITDRQHLAAMMVKRLNGDLSSPLRNKPAYRAVMERVAANNALPMLKWYIEPLEFTAAIRMISGNTAPQKKGLIQVDAYQLLTDHGLKDVQGVGGILDFATGNSQLAYRVKAYAPKPYNGAALKMLSFKNSADFTPPHWLPADAARFTILHADPQAIFANIGPIFDDIVEEPGVWDEVIKGFLDSRFRQPVDIQKELVDQLGDKLVLMTRFEKPITPQSSRFVAALTLKPGKDADVAKALAKLFSDGQDAKRIERNGFVYWQSLPEGAAPRPVSPGASGVRRPTVAPRGSASPAPNAAAASNEKESGNVAHELFFDRGGLVVGKGHVFIGNYIEDLYAIMDSRTETSPETSRDYLAVSQILSRLDAGKGERFLQIFGRSGDLIMPTYELAREGKVPESQTILGAILRAIIAGNGGRRNLDFDRSTLPPFEQIKGYFGTAGTVGTVEADGWFIEGVQLP